MSNNLKNISILFILCIIGSLYSCVEDVPKLSRAHRKIVDSLVQEQKVAIRTDLDSLCDLRFAEEIDVKIDSIVAQRIAEIRRKIKGNAK